MPNYELIYFPISGRVGVSRLLFAIADVKFTDTQHTFQQWGAIKSDRKSFPFNQLPVLRVDNELIAESLAINEYLASEFGLHGDNNLDRARVVMVSHASANLWTLWTKFAFEKDEAVASQIKEKLLGEQLPHALSCLEDILKQRHDGDKYFLGDKITLADVAFLNTILTYLPLDGTILDKYPKLKGLHQRLVALPKVAKHIPTRKLKP